MLTSLTTLANVFATHPLTREAPLSAWGRFASWQIRSRIQDEVIVPWIAGQKLAVRRGMLGATGNIYLGLNEFADMMFPLHFLREGDLFLDIGANVGSYSVLAAGVCRARSWAFEPDPLTAGHLRRNIAINALEDRVVVHECALGPSSGEVKFTIGLDTVNKVADDGAANARVVQQRRLDDVVGAAEPLMIKMDVEGYEEDVLRGAQAVLAKPCLKVIELETVTPGIEAIMRENQFERFYYDPFRRALGSSPNAYKAENTLFIRDRPFVEARLASAKTVDVLGRAI